MKEVRILTLLDKKQFTGNFAFNSDVNGCGLITTSTMSIDGGKFLLGK